MRGLSRALQARLERASTVDRNPQGWAPEQACRPSGSTAGQIDIPRALDLRWKSGPKRPRLLCAAIGALRPVVPRADPLGDALRVGKMPPYCARDTEGVGRTRADTWRSGSVPPEILAGQGPCTLRLGAVAWVAPGRTRAASRSVSGRARWRKRRSWDRAEIGAGETAFQGRQNSAADRWPVRQSHRAI